MDFSVTQNNTLLQMQCISAIQLVVVVAIGENQDADLSPPVFQAGAMIPAGAQGNALTGGNGPVAGGRQ